MGSPEAAAANLHGPLATIQKPRQEAGKDYVAGDITGMMDQIMNDTWDHLGMGQKKQTLWTLTFRLVAYRERKEPSIGRVVILASFERLSLVMSV